MNRNQFMNLMEARVSVPPSASVKKLRRVEGSLENAKNRVERIDRGIAAKKRDMGLPPKTKTAGITNRGNVSIAGEHHAESSVISGNLLERLAPYIRQKGQQMMAKKLAPRLAADVSDVRYARHINQSKQFGGDKLRQKVRGSVLHAQTSKNTYADRTAQPPEIKDPKALATENQRKNRMKKLAAPRNPVEPAQMMASEPHYVMLNGRICSLREAERFSPGEPVGNIRPDLSSANTPSSFTGQKKIAAAKKIKAPGSVRRLMKYIK